MDVATILALLIALFRWKSLHSRLRSQPSNRGMLASLKIGVVFFVATMALQTMGYFGVFPFLEAPPLFIKLAYFVASPDNINSYLLHGFPVYGERVSSLADMLYGISDRGIMNAFLLNLTAIGALTMVMIALLDDEKELEPQ